MFTCLLLIEKTNLNVCKEALDLFVWIFLEFGFKQSLTVYMVGTGEFNLFDPRFVFLIFLIVLVH